MRRRIISHSPKRSSAFPSLHTSVDLAWQTIHGRGLQLGALAQPDSSSRGYPTVGHFAVPPLVRQQLGEGCFARMRTGPPCCVAGKAKTTMGSPEGCTQVAPCPSAPSPLRPRCNIHLAAHPTSDGASHLSHMAAAWHGTLAHREPQSSAVGWRSVWPFLRKQPSPFRFDFDFPSASTCELIGYLGSQLSGKDVVHQDRSLESQAALANGTKLIPFLSLDFPPGLLKLGPQQAKGLVPSIRIMQRVPGPSTRTWHASKTRVLITSVLGGPLSAVWNGPWQSSWSRHEALGTDSRGSLTFVVPIRVQ